MYLKTIPNFFEPHNGSVKQVPYIPGEPVFNYAKAAMMIPDEQLGIIINGKVIGVEEAKTIIPDPTDYITVVCLPAGGGDNGKAVLAAIAMIVVMYYLGPAAGAAASSATGGGAAMATWSFWGWVAAIGVEVAGGYLINQYISPKAPKGDSDSSPTYGWNGVSPLYGQNQPVPVTFGTVKTAGEIVAQYVDYDGENQYMNLLIEAGEGPCDYFTTNLGGYEFTFCTGIKNIKINGNPISNYSGVQVYTRAGLNNQDVIPNFNDTITQKSLSYQYTNEGNIFSDTTPVNGQGIQIIFCWPYGLRCNFKDGDHETLYERILVEYKLESETDWKTWNTYEIARETATPFWQTFRIDNLPDGIYNVRCKAAFIGRKIAVLGEKDEQGNRPITYTFTTAYGDLDYYKFYWSSVGSITYDDFVRPNKILLGIRALATDQLSNSFTVTFELSRSNVWVYNPDAGEYQQKPANNPAWAAYWVLHRVYRLQNTHTRAWEFVVRGIPASRLLYHEFERWANFCTERGLEINIIFDTKQKLSDVIATITDMGRGMVLQRASKYGCVFDGPAEKDADGNIIPAQVYNMSNIIMDSFSEQFVDISDRSTAIEVTYYDRDNDFERTVMLVPADGLDDSQASENVTQVTWNGCTSRAQAWKEAKYRLRCNQYLKNTGTWKADVMAIDSSIGQVVMIQHDVPAWGIGGRIVSVAENTITLDQSILTDIQGETYYDPLKTYQVLVQLNDGSKLFRTVQSVDETGTIITLTTPFVNDIDSNAVFVDSEHFETNGNMIDVYPANKEVLVIYDSFDYVVKIVGSSYDSGTGKTTVQVTDNPLVESAFKIRYAWTMPQTDDVWNLGEMQKHSKPFKLGSIQRSGEMQFTLSGLEYIDELYIENTDVPEIEYSYLEPIFEVSNVVLKENTFRQLDGTMISQLNCSWALPINKQADSFLIYYSIDNGATWEYYETTPALYTYIDNVKTNTSYKVKIIVRKGALISKGIISDSIKIIGKDMPPSDVSALTITQNGSDLKFTVTMVSDPDVAYYEIRLGPSIDNSEVFLKLDWKEGTGTKEAPRTGNLTFWARAIDRSDNPSKIPARRDIEVFASIPKNFILHEEEDITTWTAQNMYFSPRNEWAICSKETIDDYDDILSMFEDSSITMADNPQLILPIIDLGEYVLQSECYYIDPKGGIHLKSVIISDDYDDLLDFFATTNSDKVEAQYMMTTYLNPTITYNQGLNNRVDVNYRTRADGDQWTDWKDASDKQFTGRRIGTKLLPVSLDGSTNVRISKATIEVDVPDRSEIHPNIEVPIGGVHISYDNRYYFIPTARVLRTTDQNGLTMPGQLLNKTRTGCDVKIYDYSGNEIAGVIDIIEIWGY